MVATVAWSVVAEADSDLRRLGSGELRPTAESRVTFKAHPQRLTFPNQALHP